MINGMSLFLYEKLCFLSKLFNSLSSSSRVFFLFLLYPGPSSLSEYFHICLQKFFAMIDLEILKKQGFVNQSDTPWIC